MLWKELRKPKTAGLPENLLLLFLLNCLRKHRFHFSGISYKRILLIWECVLILRSTTQTVIILIKTSEITLKNQKDFLKKLDVQYDNLSDQLTENQKRFQKIKADVTPEKSEELFDARVDERDTVRDQIYQKLYATMGQRFDASLFHESVSDIDHLLGEDLETFREQAYQKRALWKMERRKNSLSN